jgi:hypothetical protein
MDLLNHFKNSLFSISTESFEAFALEVFRFQVSQNPIYASYCHHLGTKVDNIKKLVDIPFLPIEFFKTQAIKTGEWPVVKVFKSSGTTATGRSLHLVEDLQFYHRTSLAHAQAIFGPLKNYRIIALLPSYLEQGDSSLVEMVQHFIANGQTGSGFYLDHQEGLIEFLNSDETPAILVGVTYALLDLAEQNPRVDLSRHIVIQTGGMKGRKKEITTAELLDRLMLAFNSPKIFTEYGMTELLSQAYGSEDALQFPNWARAFARDLNDPFLVQSQGTGILSVIDLANIHSCAFIETKDLVKIDGNGHFEVLGRVDNTDIRGCNLLIQ